MTADSPPSLTLILQRFSAGERRLAEAVLRETLPRLHQVAVRELKRERFMAPVTPTELINEIWVRNLHKGAWTIQNRDHFYAIAACAMRHVLVDLARNRLAQRRGGNVTLIPIDTLTPGQLPASATPETVVEIGVLMEQLEKDDPQAARVVDMRYFAGFTIEEISQLTGVRTRTIRALWDRGRKWIKGRLQA